MEMMENIKSRLTPGRRIADTRRAEEGSTRMAQDVAWREYGLAGSGPVRRFSPSDWYRSPIPSKRMKRLMKRSDGPGLVNFGLWLGLTALAGALLVLAWGSWWAVPAAALYGVLYGSGGGSRWHECSHGTAFRTRWLNAALYHLASFMCLKNPHLWRWSHFRHHAETIVVGRDPEIAFPRPPPVWGMVLNLLNLRAGWAEIRKMVRLALGRLTPDEKDFLDESERPKAYWTSRAHLAVLSGAIALSVALESWLPVMLVGLPTFYGSWLHHLLSATQHAGLAEDVPDHRMNSRTVRMNPFFRFVYSNMNYHLEHHMYPLVPFHALPALHEEIRADCPPPYPSVLAAYREMIPAMLRQRKDPGHHVERPLPRDAGAAPDGGVPRAAAA